jgi:signal transduction histidine kinase
VEDLLDVSRITEGKVTLKIQRIALSDVLNFAVESSRHHMDAGNHHLTVALPEAPVWFDGDYSRIAQIVANLLGNAAKYTPPGGAIKLSARTIGGEIVIEVADNGMGIPADMQARIFEAFAQVEDHRAYAQGGLGIGLALVHRLVTLHGGSVSVESDGRGRGSVFTVRLVQVEGGD